MFKEPIFCKSYGKNDPYCVEFGNERECIKIIYSFKLCISLSNQVAFMPLYSTINMEFDLINPFTIHDYFIGMMINYLPNVVVFESINLRIHGLHPTIHFRSLSECFWFSQRRYRIEQKNSITKGTFVIIKKSRIIYRGKMVTKG